MKMCQCQEFENLIDIHHMVKETSYVLYYKLHEIFFINPGMVNGKY